MSVKMKLPDKEEPVENEDISYITKTLFYLKKEGEPEIDVEGVYTEEDREIYRVCDGCGASQNDEDVKLYRVS